jgi:hypothetical protein
MRSLQTTYVEVAKLPDNIVSQSFLQKRGLQALRVTWEDTARNKGSSVGPNISDMTLCANGQDLPIIRRPNFQDLTFDVPHERIELTVGNEHGEGLRKVPLKQYLEHLDHYLHDPLALKGAKSSSFWVEGERDKNVLMGAQACMLPVGLKDGEMTEFTVALRNYQSAKDAPAVLVLVSSDKGTSAHVMNSSGREQLYFNNDGQRCALLGERLGTMRRREGRPDDGAPMNAEEQAKNVLLVIQVPLKAQPHPRLLGMISPSGVNTFAKANAQKKGKKAQTWGKATEMEEASLGFSFGGLPNGAQFDFWDESAPVQKAGNVNINELASYDSDEDAPTLAGKKYEEAPESDDMGFDLFDGGYSPLVKTIERAMVHVGPPLGPYDELCGQGPKLERDDRFPIRATLQFYFATTTGRVNAAFAQEVDEQFLTAQRLYQAIGPESSLVTGPKDTGRTTEMRPAWWAAWTAKHWDKVQARYPEGPEEAAKVVFKKGRFTLEANLSDFLEQEVLEILLANGA